MTLALHWWRPLGNPRTAAGELLRHGSAWAHAFRMGGAALNFGDEASLVAMAELTDHRIRRAAMTRAEVLGVGSILNKAWQARADAIVFGSGLRQADHRPLAMPRSLILAVRGTLTRDALRMTAAPAMGDPALVIGDVYGTRSPSPSREPLFIPHFTMLASSAGRRRISALRAGGWRIQLPTTAPRLVADAVRNAPLVATNSLHGIVFAHAVGTPVMAVDVDGHAEPRFKYDDYMSVFGLEHEPVDLTVVANRSVQALIDDVAPRTERVTAALPAIVEGLHRAASPLRSTS